MDGKLAGTMRGQGSVRKRGKEMKSKEEMRRSEQKSPELFFIQ